MIYKINCVILQWIILILTITRVNCSGQGSSEEIQTDDEDNNYYTFSAIMAASEKPNTPEEFNELLIKAANDMTIDGILGEILGKLERITIESGKYIRYIRLIGPDSMVKHNNHAFYSKETFDEYQSKFSEKDRQFEYSKIQYSAIYQSALMIEIVKHFNNLQRGARYKRKEILATIEDLHLDPNEIEYYKGRNDIKIEPIKAEMPKLNEWLKNNKTKQSSTSKSLTKGGESSSSSNITKDIWPSSEWINWLKTAPNNINTIPKKYNEMKKDEVTLIMMFNCQFPMVREVMKTYANLKGKPQLIMIDSSLNGNCNYWGFNQEDRNNYEKLFGNYLPFPNTKLSKLFGKTTAIYYYKK